MRKLMFMVFVICLMIYFFKRTVKKSKQKPSRAQKSQGEQMIQCVSCQVHVPRSEAFVVNHQFYCCEQHTPSP